MKKRFKIGNRWIGEGEPTYFIAEAGSNFDGSLSLAKELVNAAKENGAEAIKFQSFLADKIVSSETFKGFKLSFQAKWEKPVYQVYKEAEFPRNWHKEIAVYAKKQGIAFFSAPYDFEAVDLLAEINVPTFKIGSGDITWLEIIEYIAKKKRPIILSTGASTLAEIIEAIETIKKTGNQELVLMQCITNYPAKIENINLNVINSFRELFDCIIGYSDHSLGDIAVLGAVALGAKVIEKHFTLDKKKRGPDHPHAMEPQEFKEMVEKTRMLERTLGSRIKEVTPEEKETVIIQRRSLHAVCNLKADEELTEDKIIELRPATGILPKYKKNILGRKIKRNLKMGEVIKWEDLI